MSANQPKHLGSGTPALGGSGAAWYLVRSKPRQERVARDNLVRQGYRVFLPFLRIPISKRGARKARLDPMFPGYLFVHLLPHADNFAPIRSTLGVSKLVRFGAEYARVSEVIVEGIRAGVDHEDARDWIPTTPQPGDRVVIIGGALDGVEAIFSCRKGEDRVVLLISLIGRAVELENSLDGLRAADTRLVSPTCAADVHILNMLHLRCGQILNAMYESLIASALPYVSRIPP